MNQILSTVWNKLQQVTRLEFNSMPDPSSANGWAGKGHGNVEMILIDEYCFLFKESGSWSNPQGDTFDFYNAYRWKLTSDSITLEHLRFGEDSPVYLFDLISSGKNSMKSKCGHVCSDDLYTAELTLTENIELSWSVKGPKVSECIEYHYF